MSGALMSTKKCKTNLQYRSSTQLQVGFYIWFLHVGF
jgi:hypothetical protein